MPPIEERTHLEELLQLYRRNVQILEQQVAVFNGEKRAPLVLINDLELARAQVAEVEQKLNIINNNTTSFPAKSLLNNTTTKHEFPIDQSLPTFPSRTIRAITINRKILPFLVLIILVTISIAFIVLTSQKQPVEESQSAQPAFLATSTHSPVSSPDSTAPTRSIEPTALTTTGAECQSDAYNFVAQILLQPSVDGDVQFGEGLVATVHDGYLYVVHTTQGVPQIPHILKLTTSGKVEVDWEVRSGTGEGEFGFAQAIAVSEDGTVYVADGGPGRNRIQKLGSNNKFQVWVNESSGAGGLNDPRSIALDNQGNLYIADTLNHRILKFDNKGIFQREWGSFGDSQGHFNQPWGIAVYTDDTDINERRVYVYVADTENHRIQKFDSDGNYIGSWGAKGTKPGDFVQPRGVSVDSKGNVYVADSTNHRIQKFSSTGECIAVWGSHGNAKGHFENPMTVSVSEDGFVYIGDSGNHRLQIFRPNDN